MGFFEEELWVRMSPYLLNCYNSVILLINMWVSEFKIISKEEFEITRLFFPLGRPHRRLLSQLFQDSYKDL